MDDKNTGISPAMLSPVASGRSILDGTPEGIRASEKLGQITLVNSTDMPRYLSPEKAAFEAVGFKFGDKIDDVFQAAQLPAGWSRRATEHDMHSKIVDAAGRTRVTVFYKAAFYDRNADATLIPRFTIGDRWDENEHRVGALVLDVGVEIARFGDLPVTDTDVNVVYGMARLEAMREFNRQAEAWLDATYPNWRDPAAYWDEA